jgi:hypothetical protein
MRARRVLRLARAFGRDVRAGHGGGEQDAVAVHVLGDRIDDRLAVRAARGQHRHLVGQRQHFLEQAGHAAHVGEGRAHVVAGAHATWPLPS